MHPGSIPGEASIFPKRAVRARPARDPVDGVGDLVVRGVVDHVADAGHEGQLAVRDPAGEAHGLALRVDDPVCRT